MLRLYAGALVTIVVTAVGLIASPTTQGQSGPIRTATAAVVMDVTAVDRKGEPVPNLTSDDFELKEDGKVQRLLSVQFIDLDRSRQATAPVPPTTGRSNAAQDGTSDTSLHPAVHPSVPTPAHPARAASVTALLFDRLTAEERPAARRAALAWLATLAPADDYVGVFVADQTLQVASPFTNNRDQLQAAIDKAALTPTSLSRFSPDPRVAGAIPETSPTVGAEFETGFNGVGEMMKRGGGQSGQDRAAISGSLYAFLLRMERSYQAFLEEAQGHASVAALKATVQAFKDLPGRKMILYFSDALPVTDRVRPMLDHVIAAANTANVTIDTVDAAGLRVHSQEAAAARELSVAGAQGVGDLARTDGPWTRDLEHQQQVVSSRAVAVLGRLARETGGSFVSNTNDLEGAVSRMAVDRRTYYLLGYQPSNSRLDGKFRRVSIKVKRANVAIRARQGYVASAPPSQLPSR